MFEPPKVASALGLSSLRQLVDVCCLVGTDATGELCARFDVHSRLGIEDDRQKQPLVVATAQRQAAQPVELLSEVPLLCRMSDEEADAWRTAVRAAESFYLAGPTGPTGAGAFQGAAWVALLSPAAQAVAARMADDTLPTWALAVVAHGHVWLPGSTYERPWGQHPGEGGAASHAPLRARLYAALLGGGVPTEVTEYGWDGQFWGSGVTHVSLAVPPLPLILPAEPGATSSSPWLALRQLLHSRCTGAPPLTAARQDPALALGHHAAWAALALRYLFSLRLSSKAMVVRRLSALHAEVCVACVASCLTLDVQVRAGKRLEPGAGEWESPPWRCLELSSLLQSCLIYAYAATDVAGPPGARRHAPPPASLISGTELLRMFRCAESSRRERPPADADCIATWAGDGPDWWRAVLDDEAHLLARSLLRAAAAPYLPIQQGGSAQHAPALFAHVEPDAGELSALDELLQRWRIEELSYGNDEDVAFGTALTLASQSAGPDWDAPDAPPTALPAEEHIPTLLEAARLHPVVCISGETGCGKSTLVPLALMRDSIARPGYVIVTQPRRIAAVSLAKRVASTLGEEVGATVGFAIGQDRVASSSTRLLFVTTGWLLRFVAQGGMRNADVFSRASHIVLDEAHDRSLDADFLSLLLKRRLMSEEVTAAPKLVVMSATLQGDLFGRYFSKPEAAPLAPPLHIGARRFPVAEYYLDELATLGMTRAQVLGAAARESRATDVLLRDPRARAPRASRDLVDIAIQIAMHCVCPGSTVLVFLPGVAEIENAQLVLSQRYEGRAPVDVFPLHSLVPPELQVEALARPPRGRARILLATDIAESSLTLPDVRLVIDSCLKRKLMWNETRQMSSLVTGFASQAALAQRAGRSGRVQPGTVVRLLSRAAFELLPKHEAPEMLEVALDDVVLRAKFLLRSEGEDIQTLLAGAVSPPSREAVEKSLARLEVYGCLTSRNSASSLTSLGRFTAAMTRLPVPVARMLLLGVAAGAADEAVVLAAALTLDGSPLKQVLAMFAATPQSFVEDMVVNARAAVELDSGRYSEPLAWADAYRQWRANGRAGGTEDRAAWRKMRRQLSLRSMRNFSAAVRSLARDLPRAAQAARLKLSPEQLEALKALLHVSSSEEEEALLFDELGELIISVPEPAPLPLQLSVAQAAQRQQLMRLLAVAASGSNVLLASRRHNFSKAAGPLRDLGARPSRVVALQVPDWLRARGSLATKLALEAVLGYDAVLAVHLLPTDKRAAPLRARAPLSDPASGTPGVAAPPVQTEEAMYVEFGGEAVPSALLANDTSVAAKCLFSLSGGRQTIPLPVPSRSGVQVAASGAGAPAGSLDGTVSPEEQAGVGNVQVTLPFPLTWGHLWGTSHRNRLPRAFPASNSALYGVSESPGSLATRPLDSGRRYAAAGELMLIDDSVMRARSLTLLPTRGVDAELMLLALTSVSTEQPISVWLVAQRGRPAIVTSVQLACSEDVEAAKLKPWHLTHADFEVLNALRRAMNHLVLTGNSQGLPAAMDAFFRLGDVVVQRPEFVPVEGEAEQADDSNRNGGGDLLDQLPRWRSPKAPPPSRWVRLAMEEGVEGPWAPYNLSFFSTHRFTEDLEACVSGEELVAVVTSRMAPGAQPLIFDDVEAVFDRLDKLEPHGLEGDARLAAFASAAVAVLKPLRADVKEAEPEVLETEPEGEKLVTSNCSAGKGKRGSFVGEGEKRFNVGDVLLGTVQSVKPYGAFVRIPGCKPGLLHISQISKEMVSFGRRNVARLLQVGDQIKVMVLKHENDMLSLTTRALEPSPGDMLRNPKLVFDRAEEIAGLRRRFSAGLFGDIPSANGDGGD